MFYQLLSSGSLLKMTKSVKIDSDFSVEVIVDGVTVTKVFICCVVVCIVVLYMEPASQNLALNLHVSK